MKKEAFIFVLILLFVFVIGCGSDCEEPNVLINDICCLDENTNNICDIEEPQEPVVDIPEEPVEECGDEVCSENENCTSCWQDCGACKKIVYVYVPKNFTLSEFEKDFSSVTRKDVKFRRDIDNIIPISDFFVFNEKVPRYYGHFLGINFKFLSPSRMYVVHKINDPVYAVNDSDTLVRYINYTKFYLSDSLLAMERTWYENRITSGQALYDYPTQRTGHDKLNRYADWDYRNISMTKNVINDDLLVPSGGIVELINAKIINYDITYKYHEYYDRSEQYTIESFKNITEQKLDYIHSMHTLCAKNVVVSIYEYDMDLSRLSEDELRVNIENNRRKLLKDLTSIKKMCDYKYKKKVLATGPRSYSKESDTNEVTGLIISGKGNQIVNENV